jgi:integrase
MATVFKRGGRGPWILKWFDASGKRREQSSRTTDKRTAERIAAQIEAKVALRREGVVDTRMDQIADENQRPIREHIDAYLAHLRHATRSRRTIADAKAHLDWMLEATKPARLSDISLDRIEGALSVLQEEGKAARTVNHRGGSVHSFLAWCVRSGRIASNPLRHLPRQVEELDRRRVRRALTAEEVERLLEVAEPRGRKLWYLLAYMAGLRLAELKRLRWGDLDLKAGVLTVRQGKAKRVDRVPLHPDLRAELARVRPTGTLPSAPVFPTAPTNETRVKDYRRAGIKLLDDEGRVADLHSLRVTLATTLAVKGVPPQVLRKIMRHSRSSTTEQFYVHLRDEHTAAAIAVLNVEVPSAGSPHHSPHHSQHETGRRHAK